MENRIHSSGLIPLENFFIMSRNSCKSSLFISINIRLSLFISIYFCLIPSVSAYTTPDSLSHYLEIAAKNNPNVQQKFYEYQAALQRVPQVGSLSDPELSLGLFLKPMELVNGNQLADIRLMQMFPWFGVLKSAKDEMSQMANAKFELFRDAKLQVFYDVQRTWFELYKVSKDITISEKNAEILKIIERIALVNLKSASLERSVATYSKPNNSTGSARDNNSNSAMQSMEGNQSLSSSSSNPVLSTMQAGSMSSQNSIAGLADFYKIQIESGDLENNIALLKNRQNSILALFNSYLNRPSASPVFLPEKLTVDSLGLLLVSVSDSIPGNNPMLGMLEYEKLSIEARSNMVRRMGYPMVGLGINYSLINKNEMSTSPMNGNDMIMPMVTVTLPIYRKKYVAMKTETDLLKSASLQNYQAIANSLQAEYYEAVQLYQDAQRRIRLYDIQFQLASKSLDLMLKSFSVAASGLTDVLRIRQQTLEYEYKQVEAVTDLNRSVAWLKRLGNLEIGNEGK
jgi:outer membrane protein TolC